MSNFSFKAKNKITGERVVVTALDNYFGNREYGYIPSDYKALTEGEFNKIYEKLNEEKK